MKRRPTPQSQATRELGLEHEYERERERVRDLKDLLAQRRRTEVRVADAMVTVLRRAAPDTLAAFGVVLEFVAKRRRGRAR